MKQIKFSLFCGLATLLLYILVDVLKVGLAFTFGFVNMPKDSLSPLGKGFEALLDYSDKNYIIYFALGFVIGFPLFYFKRKIDKWVKKNSLIQ